MSECINIRMFDVDCEWQICFVFVHLILSISLKYQTNVRSTLL